VAGNAVTVTLQIRTLWLSGLHLGSGTCRCTELLRFLDGVHADTVFLVGDVVDSRCAATRFPARDAETWLRLSRCARDGSRVIYLPGAYDREAARHAGQLIGGVEYRASATHVTADGRRLLIVHGAVFDEAVRAGSALRPWSALAYPWLLRADARFGALRGVLGTDFARTAAGVRLRLEQAQEYMRRFESEARRHAAGGGYDGIVCGHLHQPALREDDGILYAGNGDWIEHAAALAEFSDGTLRFLAHGAGDDRHGRGDPVSSLAA
jgi:UDP-2,3-diacylglucosamine pyrophosphatase LpxH